MKKIIVLILAISIFSTLFIGCSNSTSTITGDEIVVCLGSEPKSIDPTLNNAVDGATMIIHAFEGLTKLDKDGKVVPGVAKSWTTSSDGSKFTFILRDSKWSDGVAVKAEDFVYSWRRALDQKVGAEYAYQMYYIKNGQALNEGKAKPEDLGVNAIDDKTLEVTLQSPTSYFLELTSFPTYFPLRKDIIDKDPLKWATNPDTYISNGPFKLETWNHDSDLVFVKNPNYWDKDSIKPGAVKFTLIADDNAILAAFKNDEIMYSDSMPTEEIPALKKEGVLRIDPLLGTYYYCFNVNKAPFDNLKVRKAFTLAIDRQYIIDKIAQGDQIPAGAFVPPGIPDVNTTPDFRTIGKNYYDPTSAGYAANVAEAQKLLSEAGYPGGKNFPQVEFLYNTEGGHKAIGEAIQEMWKKKLGITIKLSGQEWATFQQTRTDKNFQIARHGWLGDYVDPMTFLDMWTSYSGQNDAGWKNTAFDNDISTGKSSSDRAARMTAMHKAEDLFMNSYAVAPIYYYTDLNIIKSYLKGSYTSPLGFKYFMYSSIQK